MFLRCRKTGESAQIAALAGFGVFLAGIKSKFAGRKFADHGVLLLREWVQGLDNYFWDAKRVQDELQKIMERAFDAVNAKADEADCDYRTAAYTIAISRVAEACRLKGLFP